MEIKNIENYIYYFNVRIDVCVCSTYQLNYLAAIETNYIIEIKIKQEKKKKYFFLFWINFIFKTRRKYYFVILLLDARHITQSELIA